MSDKAPAAGLANMAMNGRQPKMIPFSEAFNPRCWIKIGIYGTKQPCAETE